MTQPKASSSARPPPTQQEQQAQQQQQQLPQDGETGSAVSSAAGPGGSSSGGHVVTGPPRRVSTAEVQMVQNLIERCMQQYIPQAQVVSLLHQQAKIEPSFTSLVWQKLEEQNQAFFKLYYVRLKLKEQIVMFNYLLEQQVNMVQKLYTAWIQALPSMMAPPGAAMRPPPMMPGMPFPFPGMLPPGMPPGMMPPGAVPPLPPPPLPAAAVAAVPAPDPAAPAPPSLTLPPLPSSMDGLDLLEGALEASENLDLSALQLHGDNVDDLMEGITLDVAAAGDVEAPGAGGALALDLHMPKTLSFSDLGAFDFNLGSGLDNVMDFGLHHVVPKEEQKEHHQALGLSSHHLVAGCSHSDPLGMPSDHGLGTDSLHDDHALGVGGDDGLIGLGAGAGLQEDDHDHVMGAGHHGGSGSDAFAMGLDDIDMGIDLGMRMGQGPGSSRFKRNFSIGDMSGLEPPSGNVNLADMAGLDYDMMGKA